MTKKYSEYVDDRALDEAEWMINEIEIIALAMKKSREEKIRDIYHWDELIHDLHKRTMMLHKTLWETEKK